MVKKIENLIKRILKKHNKTQKNGKKDVKNQTKKSNPSIKLTIK